MISPRCPVILAAAEFAVVSKLNSCTVLPCEPCAIIWTMPSTASFSVLVDVCFMNLVWVQYALAPSGDCTPPHLSGGMMGGQRAVPMSSGVIPVPGLYAAICICMCMCICVCGEMHMHMQMLMCVRRHAHACAYACVHEAICTCISI